MYTELERRADALRAEMRTMVETAAGEGRELTGAERDRYFNMQGEADTLMATARELRDAETAELRELAERPQGPGAGEPGSDARAQMRGFIREARVDGLHEMRSGELLAGTAANGGVLVPEPVHADFVDLLTRDIPVLALARMYEMTGADSVTIQRKTAQAATGGIKGETDARPTTNAATYDEVTLKAFEYYANPRASQLFLDSVANAEADIYADIIETLRQDYGADLITGAGSTTAPEGLLAGITAHVASGSASTIVNTGLHSLVFALESAYAARGAFLMRRATLGVCDTLSHPAAADKPLVTWQGDIAYILGKRVYECEDMPAIGGGAFPVFFGDISQAYGCGVHKNWTMLRDPYTDKPFIHFYTTGRMGGVVRDVNAGKKLEIAVS